MKTKISLSRSNCLSLRTLFILLCSLSFSVNVPAQLPGKTPGGAVLLPNGWSLTPAGIAIELGDLPLSMDIDEIHHRAAVLHAGMGKQTVDLIDIQLNKVVSTLELPSLWLGIRFYDNGNRLAVSGGGRNVIYLLTIRNDSLLLDDSIVVNKGSSKQNIFLTGLDIAPDGKTLYVVTKDDKALYECDLKSKSVRSRTPLPAEAYACRYYGQEKTIYITLWGGKELIGVDGRTRSIVFRITTGDHPTDMALSSNGKWMFIANANENSVSVIDRKKQKVVEILSAALNPDLPPGSTPNSLALAHHDSLLFVANADNNCLAVFDVSKPGSSRSLGFIPTGWYPTSVRVAKSKGGKEILLVLNGKGTTSLPNPGGPNPMKRHQRNEQYIGTLLRGSISIIPIPSKTELVEYTMQVYANTPLTRGHSENCQQASPIIQKPSPIRHVFYIIKENRTYDQVFGDIKGGNGEPSLCLFPDSVTPNHHALAREFVLLDNFYADAEVSADGHNWSMAAYATDYVEKLWPTVYSRRGSTYDFEGSAAIAGPSSGYIWDNCARHGVTYRSYGEFTEFNPKWKPGDTVKPAAAVPTLIGHVSPTYRGFDLNYKDVDRAAAWIKEFDELEKEGAIPQFEVIRLPNDHTIGTQVGMPTPMAYVADNDLALGLIVERISHSSIWKESAIFVVEDDAQNGPDHVDAHRTVALVISPYAKRHAVDHTLYSTTSMIKTMEMILGLPPMTQFDSAATAMCASFTSAPDFTPFKHQIPKVDLNEVNTAEAYGSKRSAEFNFALEDRAPDLEFNEIIWKAVRGKTSEMPPPVRGAFISRGDLRSARGGKE